MRAFRSSPDARWRRVDCAAPDVFLFGAICGTSSRHAAGRHLGMSAQVAELGQFRATLDDVLILLEQRARVKCPLSTMMGRIEPGVRVAVATHEPDGAPVEVVEGAEAVGLQPEDVLNVAKSHRSVSSPPANRFLTAF